MLLASDGSQIGPKASFGWILSTLEGNRIVTCSEPCFGAKPNCYSAEGSGLLSVSRLLHRIRSHFNVPMRGCSVVCDNESMVTKVAKTPEYLDDPFPNQTGAAGMWIGSRRCGPPTTNAPQRIVLPLVTLKGHQDKLKAHDELSLRAQLNCDADELADQFIHQNPDMDYSVVPLLPTSDIQLHLPIGILTHHLKMEVHQARHIQPLVEHLKEKFNWSQDTFDTVDWETNRIARNQLTLARVTLLKHLNDITPVGRRVHRHEPKYPKACPSCEEPDINGKPPPAVHQSQSSPVETPI